MKAICTVSHSRLNKAGHRIKFVSGQEYDKKEYEIQAGAPYFKDIKPSTKKDGGDKK